MDYNVYHYGAIGDGKAKDTKAIQKAIEVCSENGGGRVILAEGIFLTGTLYMRSRVELHIDIDATLLGSAEYNDYGTDTFKQLYRNEAHMDRCLIYCKDADHIAFTGRGTINGQGELFVPETAGGEATGRPMLIRYLNCTDIRLKDLRLRNPASWTNAFLYCNDIWVNGIDIVSRANHNGDGLDFDGCENVFVSDCKLDCSDDCICLQASRTDKPCKNIVITNSLMTSYWAGIRIGLLSCGNIENVTVTNCIFRDIHCSGLKLQSAEGGILRNMIFSSLIMENVQRPIFATLNHFRENMEEAGPVPETGRLENIQFNQITATGKPDDPKFLRSCIILDGLPEQPLQRISITNLQYTAVGGATIASMRVAEIPRHIGRRAECFNYDGALPAYGIYARNVNGLQLHNVNILTLQPDERPMLVTEN
jgi:polygalacturonase